MESKARRTVPLLIKELLENPREFSFLQAVRLIRSLAGKDANGKSSGSAERYIRFRPKLSLDYPSTDIDDIEVIDMEKGLFRMTATFLGLYGTGSPLPTFYTEELLEDVSDDITVTREFLDLFHTPLYSLFFQAATRYRIPYKVVEENDESLLNRLYALSGYADPEMRRSLPESSGLLRHLGAFTQYPRSADVLRGLIADITGIREIRIEQCVPSIAEIPEEQRCCLGRNANRLGMDAYAGLRIRQCTEAFRVAIGPVDAETFNQLLPGAGKAELIASIVNLYNDQPLEWDIEVEVSRDSHMNASLGTGEWRSLGVNAWVGTPRHSEELRTARFYPSQLKQASAKQNHS
jgi:type VI secretion system protein ImpH